MNIQLNQNTTATDILIPVFSDFDTEELSTFLNTLAGESTKQIISDFKGDAGESQTVYSSKNRLFLLGLGSKKHFGSVCKIARQFSIKNKRLLKSEMILNLTHCDEYAQLVSEALINGLITGTFLIGTLKTTDQTDHPFSSDETSFTVISRTLTGSTFQACKKRALAVAESQIRMLDLVNLPSNVKTPEYIASHITAFSESTGGFKATILTDDAIWENNLMALAAVNRGSEESAQFIILEYSPEIEGTYPSVGLVGKAVTYDTGGLSIKPSDSMSYMKSDMGGAAAVIGAFEAAVKLKLPVNLIAIIPVTDNLVDALSVKPGDVINSYSGKTIEVVNTDAEGRLILADGLSYLVKNFEVDHIIDLATLTGATIRTLGNQAAGLFSNNDTLAHLLEQTGSENGDRLWRFPLWEEYGNDIQSDVADIKNVARSPVAGAIHAAKFLEAFIENHPSWAHIDMAGVSFGDNDFGKDKGATAWGIRLLVDFLEKV